MGGIAIELSVALLLGLPVLVPSWNFENKPHIMGFELFWLFFGIRLAFRDGPEMGEDENE